MARIRRLFVAADMEGCSAIAAPQALRPEGWAWEWTAARRWMTAEVVAAAKLALDAKYDEVIVSDNHGNAHNIDPDQLPRNVRLVRSWPRPQLHMQGIETEGVDACAFIGYHAPPSSQDSILAHIFSGATYRSIKLNGEVCSEGYLNAALAGEFGKPVIFVSGDGQTIEDARRYAPEAVLFITKQSIGWRSQSSLPPAQNLELLTNAFKDALSNSKPRAFTLHPPFYLELEMTTQVAAEMLAYLPGVSRQSAFTVGATFESVVKVMHFVCFAMLYTPTGIPPL